MPISAEDPYASMEKDQLISMIHFLVKREDERAQENQELKDMVKDLRDTHIQMVARRCWCIPPTNGRRKVV